MRYAIGRGARRLAATIAACGALASAGAAGAQGREFPTDTRFGVLEITAFPSARLDGNPVTLAPGARIRSESNALLLPQQVPGAHPVRYRVDFLGQLKEAWLLTAREAEEARSRAGINTGAAGGATTRDGENTR